MERDRGCTRRLETSAQKRFVASSLQRLTSRTRRVLDVARDIADDQGAAALRLDHLALALYSEPTTIGAQVLSGLGATRESLDEAIYKRARVRGPRLSDEPPVDRAILAAALDLGHNYIGTEHVLLACVRHPTSLIAKAMKDAGAPESKVRPAVLAALDVVRKT